MLTLTCERVESIREEGGRWARALLQSFVSKQHKYQRILQKNPLTVLCAFCFASMQWQSPWFAALPCAITR